mgnify:FL=1
MKTNKYSGTKTEQNLRTAFSGESEARNKYTFFASTAKKEGYEQIAALFQKTADNEKEHAKMCDALAKGDEVMTMGGISGRIESVDEQSMALQVASVDGKPVVIRMQRSAVQMVLPKGSVKF